MKDESRRLLPPMAMLHSFAAAARTGSFSRAALEIGLTQGAVSRQVAALEELVGRALFDRHGRRVMLNDDGRRYAEGVEASLAGLRRATRDVIEGPAQRAIELAVLPSFGMRWLAPRLPELTALHPDLVVNFTARSDEFSFVDEPFDAAIHFGRPNWPGAQHDLLFRETTIPVLSPRIAPQSDDPAALLDLPLLALSSRRDAWPRWFADQNVTRPVPSSAASYNNFLMLAHVAAAGGGVALIPEFLIQPELAAGTLVPCGRALRPTEDAYYLVYPQKSEERPAFTILRRWINRLVSDQPRPDRSD